MGELKLFSLAESLGGVEFIVHQRVWRIRAMGETALAEAGISQLLLRLSVGLEDASDLIADLDQAFTKAKEKFLMTVLRQLHKFGGGS